MEHFWSFAARMGRYRFTIVAALLMAFISGAGLGVGILGTMPVLQAILDDGDVNDQTDALTAQARQLDSRLGGAIPDAWINALPTDRYHAVIWVMSALGVLTIIGASATFMHAYLSLTVVTRTIARVRREAFQHVVHLSLRQVLVVGPSDMISRIVNDTAALGRGLTALMSRGVTQITRGIAGLAVAFTVNWKLSFVAIAVGLILGTIIRKLAKKIRRASRKALESQAGLYHRSSEVLAGLRVVKVYGQEDFETGRFNEVNNEVVRQELKVRRARALSSPLVETLTIFTLGILSVVAAKAIINARLEPAEFLVSLAALGVAGASLKPLTGIINDLQQAAAAADRVAAVMHLEAEEGHDDTLPALPRHEHAIELNDISFSYPRSDTPAIANISLNITRGETVAFVGPNGSGKTTLLSLIPRLFEPSSGSITIDGHDIATHNIKSLRHQIGVVTQEVILFKGTIAENIAYGAGTDGVSDDVIKHAAKSARADDFIVARNGGYDSEIGEDGVGLSGGQRQRLAIARAILRDPAILILDEATSMIDADSEAKINEALREFAKDRTCLIVAHRLSTVVNADRIVVMNEGRIEDIGTHDELLTRCNVYQTIAEHQLVRQTA